MNDDQKNEHLTAEFLQQYLAGELSDDQEFLVDDHLGRCDQCARMARTGFRFSRLWESWTAEAHGRAHDAFQSVQKERIVSAIAEAEAEVVDPEIRSQLRRWREKWHGLVGGAVRMIMNMPGETSRILTEGLDTLLIPGKQVSFAYGVGKPGVQGEQAGSASKTIVRSSQLVGGQTIEIQIDGKTQEFLSVLRGGTLIGLKPVILLIPNSPSARTIVLLPEEQLGTDALLKVMNIPSGDYLVVFPELEGPS